MWVFSMNNELSYPVTNYWSVFFIFCGSHCTTVIAHEDSEGRQLSEGEAIFVIKITGNVWVVTAIVSTKLSPQAWIEGLLWLLPFVQLKRQNWFRRLLSQLFDLPGLSKLIVKVTWFITGENFRAWGVWSFLIHLLFKRNANPRLNCFALFSVFYLCSR